MSSRSSLVLSLTGLLCLIAGILLWYAPDALDRQLFAAIRLNNGSAWIAPLRAFTALGSFVMLAAVSLAVTLWLFVRGQRGAALWLLLTTLGCRLLVEALKIVIARPRPPVGERLTEINSLSFPSAHAANGLLTALAIAMLFPAARRFAIPAAFVFGLTISVSRIALGVHWPSDIVGGLGVAMICAGIAARWQPSLRP